MIEINFFEKKKKNIVPIIYTVIFLLGILLIGGYVGGSHVYFARQTSRNQAFIDENQVEVVEARRKERVLTQLVETENDMTQLTTDRHPTIFLYDEIHEVFADADNTVQVYQFTVGEPLYIELMNIDLDMAAHYMVELQAVSFIDHVELNSTYLEESDEYRAEFQLMINEEVLREEWREDDVEVDA